MKAFTVIMAVVWVATVAYDGYIFGKTRARISLAPEHCVSVCGVDVIGAQRMGGGGMKLDWDECALICPNGDGWSHVCTVVRDSPADSYR